MDLLQQIKEEVQESYLTTTDAWERGMALCNDGNQIECILYLKAAVYQDPKNAKKWKQLGIVLSDNEMDSVSINALTESYRLDPKDLETLLFIARYNLNNYKYPTFKQNLMSWLLNNSLYSVSWSKFVEEKNRELKIQDIREYLLTHPNHQNQEDSDIEKILSYICFSLYKHDVGIGYMENAIAISEKKGIKADIYLLNGLGALMISSGAGEISKKYYLQALRQKPSFLRPLLNLSDYYKWTSRSDKALACVYSALNINHESPTVWKYVAKSEIKVKLLEFFKQKNELIGSLCTALRHIILETPEWNEKIHIYCPTQFKIESIEILLLCYNLGIPNDLGKVIIQQLFVLYYETNEEELISSFIDKIEEMSWTDQT